MSEPRNAPYAFGEPRSGQLTLECVATENGKEFPLTIGLEELHQSLTYAGVLEGYPNHGVNQHIIRKATAFAQSNFGGFRPQLIAPRETAIELSEEDSPRQIILLPAVRCIGSFTATHPTQPGAGDFSALTIVWFQDDWVFPIQKEVINTIRSLPWTALARNGTY